MSETINETQNIDELRGLINELEHKNEQLLDRVNTEGAQPISESQALGRIGLAVDNIGWNPLGSVGGEKPIGLDTVRKISDTAQALAIVNPMVKSGLSIGTAYVWGHDVEIIPRDAPWASPSLYRAFGTPMAQAELDKTIACDGNVFFLVDTRLGTVQRIPMDQITGTVLAPGNPEHLMYIRRTYTTYETAQDVRYGDSAVGTGRAETVWYPTDELEGPAAASIQQIRVDRDKVMIHVPFNRHVGWTWGVPDVLSVIFWSQAYKEFLENCATLTKAYARFAWKVVSNTKRGQARVASRVAQPPQRDGATGTYSGVGDTVSLGANQDLQAVQNARGVDFNAGRPMAALVAAGLGVPLTALTSDPSEGNRATAETLDEPTRLGMEVRQRMRGDLIQRVLHALGVRDHVIEWPAISPEPLHRVVQGLDQAGRTGMLYSKEWRGEILKALHLHGLPEEPPNEEELPVVLQQGDNSFNGNGAQPDPPSRRDNELRDEPGQQPSAEDNM